MNWINLVISLILNNRKEKCDQGPYIGFLRIIVYLPLNIQLLSIIKSLEKKIKKYSRAHFFFFFLIIIKAIFFLNFTKLIKLIKLNIYIRKRKKKKSRAPRSQSIWPILAPSWVPPFFSETVWYRYCKKIFINHNNCLWTK